MKLQHTIILIIIILLSVVGIANAQTAQQPSFTPSLIPITDSKYYLGSTSPARKWAGIYITGSDGCLQLTSGLINSTGSACGSGGGGGTFPFTVNTWGNSTTSTLGFLNGFLSTASSTISAPLRLSSLGQGFLFTGSGGLVQPIASSSVKLSWFNNDAGFVTSAVTSVTGTFPISSTGGNTPVISSAFSTTTNTGMSQGNVYIGSGGILQTSASSSIFGYTPLNPTRAITINGTANQITSSAGSQDLSADRTWTLSFPNQVIFPQYASTTLGFSTPYASSTLGYFGSVIAHLIKGDASDGLLVEANNGTDVAILGAGNSANATFYGGVNIDGATRLATSLTGILKASSGSVSTATNGTDYTLITSTTCSGSDKVSAISSSGSVTCSADQTGGGGFSGSPNSIVVSDSAGTALIATSSHPLYVGAINATSTSLINRIGKFLAINGSTGGSAAIDVKSNTSGSVQGLRIEADSVNNTQFSSFVTGDAQVRFSFLADGIMKWSSGALTPDIQLYRPSAGKLSLIGLNAMANTASFGIGTTTPYWGLTISSTTMPQLALQGGINTDLWTMRSIGNSFYLATSSPTTYATSSVSALSINSNGQLTIPNLSATDCDVKSTTSGTLYCGTDATGGGGSGSSKWATSTDTISIYPAGATKLGLGSTTPWGSLSILGGNTYPLLHIATSTTEGYGDGLLHLSATTSTLISSGAANDRLSEIGVRMGIGLWNYEGYGGLLDQLTVKGRINTEGWLNTLCINSQQVSLSVDGVVTSCGSFYFAEDGTATAATGSVTGGGATYTRVGATATNDGTGIFANGSTGTGWLTLATSTPIIEVNLRIRNSNLDPAYYIGFSNINIAGTTYETEPTVGCYLTASSTTANWRAICRTAAGSGNMTMVDTGVASTSSFAANGTAYQFRKFRIQADSTKAEFFIKSTESGSLTKVAEISTNYPTNTLLNAGIHTGQVTANTNSGFDMFNLKFWWRDNLPRL